MRTIATEHRITIRKIIDKHPLLAKSLTLNGESLEKDIEQFSALTGLEVVFIKQNLQQIRNWI